MQKLCIYIAFLLLLTNCKKEDETVFEINIEQTIPTEIIEFKENIYVTLTYEHPLGYLGFQDPDYLSLEVKDSRLNNPDYYHLIPVNPPNETLSTNGEILIEIDAPFILGNSNLETLVFEIRIQDREMNWSNKVKTPFITLNKE